MPNDVGDGVHYRETQDESRRERAVDVDGVDTPGESRRARPDPGGQERGKLLNLRLCATDELRRRVHFQNLDYSQPQGGLPVRYCSYGFNYRVPGRLYTSTRPCEFEWHLSLVHGTRTSVVPGRL